MPDPALAAQDRERLRGIAAGPDDDATARAARTLCEDARILAAALCVGQVSRAAFATACLDPGWLVDVVRGGWHREVWGRDLLLDRVLAEAGALRDEARRASYCRSKRRQDLRLILGDAEGALSFQAIVAELSDLADALIQAASTDAAERHAARFACGSDPLRHFAVLGMGKLGGRELNYSSDIDLIFVYEQSDSGDDEHTAFCRLGAELVRILSEPTDAGRLYRVDMRLRPEGDRGELALSRQESMDYYELAGRPWERQALIKARSLLWRSARADEPGRRLLRDLAAWIYPVDPPAEVLDEARTMRRRIEERARERDVKTGAGGIRDIEFLAQYFQLLYGGRDPGLRARATLPTLRALADRGTIPRADADELESHYRWLRTVEHRLQMWEDQQEHEVPADPAARAALAGRCGLIGGKAHAGDQAQARSARLAAFDRELAERRSRVRSLAARHFLDLPSEHDAALTLLVQGEADLRLAQRVLGAVGFRDVPAACQQLRRLAEEPFLLASRARTERHLVAILPLLLHLIAQSPEPDATLANLGRMVGAVGGRAAFFALLAERPRILELLVSFAGWATFLVDLFATVPGLPDELADTLSIRPKPAAALRAEAQSVAHGLSAPAEPLAFLMARETAATAVRDLEGLSADDVGERLTVLAEAVVEAGLTAVTSDLAKRWGVPVEHGRPTRFAVLALGKIGGREPTYASDLDVLYVSDPGGHCPREDRGGDAFWQRIAETLARQLLEARVCELDARLRPWGDQGSLVCTTADLERYWQDPRDLWERLAMLRLAPLAGHRELASEVIAHVRRRAISAELPATAVAELRVMRRRLEDSVHGRDHLKRGWGGYVDHEFIAQYFCLGLPASAWPTHWGTAQVLRHLATIGRIPVAAADALIPGLARLRFIESRMRLAAGKAISSLPTDADARRAIARRCGYPDLATFDLELHLTRESARTWFDRLLP